MRSVSTLVAGISLIGLVLSAQPADTLAAAGPAPAPQGAKPVPSSEESVKAGAVIYARTCRACHGMQGRGDGIAAPPGQKPANLTDGEWKHGSTDAEIFKVIKEGIAPYEAMKPMAKVLPDKDIWSVVHYVRTLAKPKK
jgi:mono/diheme cytochrome c family protein